MEKLRMESVDMTQKNIERIAALFPNVITEKKDEDGRLIKAINFELLKQELSDEIVDGNEERYEFSWVGKKASMIEANRPIRKTLRPCIDESKEWENTENLYIEGDNLEVLKLIQESYLNSIKMIYIDPPYNTGNDFIYRDDFSTTKEIFEDQIGIFDDNNNRLFKNNDTNGRFHSDWCSMMFSRLKLAKNILNSEGVLFISVDDNEQNNLKSICDEIFGESNFISCLIWQSKKGGGNDSTHMAVEHEYILVYAKDKNSLGEFYEMYSDDYLKRYKEIDDVGMFYWDTFKRKSGKQYYPIKCPDGTILEFDDDGNPISWLRSEQRFINDLKIGDVKFVDNGGKWSIQFKQRLPLGKTPRSLFQTEEIVSNYGTTSEGSNDVYNLFKKEVFSNPKPVRLMEFLVGFGMGINDTILDFFSGSGTVAEAVMKCNAADGGNRKYILVQLQEDLDYVLEKTPANKKMIVENAISILDECNKKHYISELAKERIRRAGDKISDQIEISNSQNDNGGLTELSLDLGFRVFRVDETNMKNVYYSADEYNQDLLLQLESNIKEDRTDIDLLYGIMLDWSIQLSLKHHVEEIEGVRVHTVDDGSLIACFADVINEKIVREIAIRQPLRVVFRDSSFSGSPDKINVEEIFKLHAPNTIVKVL